jgi:glycosyltransferase involved in cell wall biosynthesis/SAM-dependent methyltransferase
MRILLVSSYPPDRCGIASYAVQMAAALRRQGHQVEVISPRPSAAQHWADYSRAARGVLRVLALSRRADRTIVQLFPDLLFTASSSVGMLRRLSFLRRWVAAALLFRLGRRVELVVHEAPYRALSGRRDLRGRIGRAMWRTLVTLPEATFVHTRWERQQLVDATGVDAGRIRLLPHGDAFVRRAGPDRPLARRELGLPDDSFLFLSIGYLQPHKGFDRGMRALSDLAGDPGRVQLHVVGSARVLTPEVLDHVDELRRLASTIPGVTLHEEYVSDEAFDRWIVASDAVVLPYRDIWSSGVLERAKLYGRPAIVSDAGGLRDQAEGSTRVVCDDDELRQAMAELSGAPLRGGTGAGPAMTASTDELSHEDASALVRLRADDLRQRFEPGSAPRGDRQGPPPLVLPAPPPGRGTRALVKRLVGKLTRWQLAPIVGRVNELQDATAALARRDREIAELRERLDGLAARSEDRGRRTNERLDELRAEVARQEQLRGRDRAQLGAELAALRPAAPAQRPGEDGARTAGGPLLDALYETHQDRFRGSREEIRARQEVYLPHVRLVASEAAPVLDVGPGRGEWLDLLQHHGIRAYGVDVNAAFVEAGREMGIDIRLEDGLAHLRRLPEASLSAVTAFHVVEHLPAESLVDLVDQSLRALRPGGVLILETPNPLNLAVGAASFHLDPTHVRPVHPLFLEFVLASRGFTRVRTLTLHPPDEPPLEIRPEDPEALRRAAELLNRHFFAGQDYAVLGYRARVPESEGASADGARELPATDRAGVP